MRRNIHEYYLDSTNIFKTELLRGAKNKQEFNQLSQLLKGLTYLAVHEDFWERLSEFSFQLFRKRRINNHAQRTWYCFSPLKGGGSLPPEEASWSCPLVSFKI